MENYLRRLSEVVAKIPSWSLLVIVGLLGIMAWRWDHPESPIPAALSQDGSPDTYIPQGYVLVPIEIQNAEALDSILGKYGVVDLFEPALDGGPGKKIAERIRILRAPLNPSRFAVLAPEAKAPQLVRHEGLFFVVIQNPNQFGTRFVNTSPKKRSVHVEYGE